MVYPNNPNFGRFLGRNPNYQIQKQQAPIRMEHHHFRLFAWVIIAAVLVILIVLVFSGGNKERNILPNEIQGFKEQLLSDFNPSSITGQISKEYDLPKGYTEFCVIDKENVDISDIVDKLKVRKSSDLESGRNIFLLGSKGMVSFSIEDVVLPAYPYYSCIESSNGGIEMTLDNLAGKTLVKLPPNSDYCRNAQNKQSDDGSNLCKYLDEVYYEGYKEGCCNNYGFCC
jgi:hypothetical protein